MVQCKLLEYSYAHAGGNISEAYEFLYIRVMLSSSWYLESLNPVVKGEKQSMCGLLIHLVFNSHT